MIESGDDRDSCVSSEQGADKPAGRQLGDDFSLVRTQVNYVIVYKSSSAYNW